jgi:hypothetical protein
MLGSIGAGAGSGLTMKREADRYDREEALANRQLDVQEANYAAQAAADFASMNYAAQQDTIENVQFQLSEINEQISDANAGTGMYTQDDIDNLVAERERLSIVYEQLTGYELPTPGDLWLTPPDES